MQVYSRTPSRLGGQGWPVPAEEGLERALVVGLMLEATLEASGLPSDPRGRRRHIKSRLTYSLVTQLAGRITLDRFRTLMRRLEKWFPYYYPLLPPLPQMEESPFGPGKACRFPADVPRSQRLVHQDLLKDWLETTAGEILPSRPQRKIQPERLREFLQRTEGNWFRVKDLAQDFDVDRKTAWEYLQKLLHAGLLAHNRGRSAAARYRLADYFLKIRLAALEEQVAQALPGLPRPTAEQTTAWLAATAGESFWENHWPGRLATGRRQEIIASLKTMGVLEVLGQSGHQRLLRLHNQWLKD